METMAGPTSTSAVSETSQEFLKEIETLKASIDAINEQVRQLETLHANSLLNVNQDEAVRNHQVLEATTDSINAGLQQVQIRLKKLDAATNAMPKTPEYQLRKSQQSAVAKKLTEVASNYNDVQSRYKQKYKERMERQYRIGL